MAQKGRMTECGFNASLTPHKKIGLAVRGQLWQNLLGTRLRTNLGNPEINHITMGTGGESHIEYRLKGLEIVLYDDGDLSLDDYNFAVTRSTQVERALTALFKVMNDTTKKKIDFDVTMSMHIRFADKSLSKFMTTNVHFIATRKLRRAFGKIGGVRSFLLRLTDNLDMVVFSSNHIDFLYHATVSSGSDRKPFVRQFVANSMKYVESMRRYA